MSQVKNRNSRFTVRREARFTVRREAIAIELWTFQARSASLPALSGPALGAAEKALEKALKKVDDHRV